MEKKVICWDLDETLGHFKRIGSEMEGKEPFEFDKPNSLRYGMSELLESLSSKGYEHHITSSAKSEYINEVLERTGLSHHISGVYGGEDICIPFEGKKYLSVAKAAGFSREEAISNMVVIGDAIGDKPLDLDGLVFIWHQKSTERDSKVTEVILDKLYELGDGDFNKGFKRIYEDSKMETWKQGNFDFQVNTYHFGEGIKAEIKYEVNANGEKVVPVITSIVAPSYMKEPVLLDEI